MTERLERIIGRFDNVFGIACAFSQFGVCTYLFFLFTYGRQLHFLGGDHSVITLPCYTLDNIKNNVLQEGAMKTANRKKDSGAEHRSENFIKNCHNLIGNLCFFLFTTTIFLGGSYLFFVQLAEYGW